MEYADNPKQPDKMTAKTICLAEELRESIELFFRQMQDDGVSSVDVSYHGSGDDGHFAEPKIQPEGSKSDKILSMASHLAERQVEVVHPGWENEDGGCGSIIFALRDGNGCRTATLCHEEYYEESSCFENLVFRGDWRDADNEKIKAIFQFMNLKSLFLITVTYSGYGDSGDLEELTLGDGTISAVDCEIHDVLESFSWDIITKYHAGWENNEGGRGTISIIFNKEVGSLSSVGIEHDDRYIESNHHETVCFCEPAP